jgi:hypothetical protein
MLWYPEIAFLLVRHRARASWQEVISFLR